MKSSGLQSNSSFDTVSDLRRKSHARAQHGGHVGHWRAAAAVAAIGSLFLIAGCSPSANSQAKIADSTPAAHPPTQVVDGIPE